MNTGAYTTYQKLLMHLYPSTFVSYKSAITLSNKAGNVFEYAGATFDLAEGDIITQGEYAQHVTALQTGPNRLTVDDATNIADGDAYVFRSSKRLDELNVYRSIAMQTVDLHTGQWFNARSFDSSNPVKYDGNNTRMIHFPVPIIEITSLKLNNETTALSSNAYQVFNGRSLPDDRRNPKVMLMENTQDTIYTSGRTHRFFLKDYFTLIEGTFGFVEEDGSTPEAIQWATARLVALNMLADQDPTSTNQTKKREKTDLHEVEYDTSSSTPADSIQTKMTGDNSVDKILMMYKAPIGIGATTPSVFKNYYRVREYYRHP